MQQKIERTPEDIARLRELRERYQREKPSIADLKAQGAVFAPLGEVLLLLSQRKQITSSPVDQADES